MNSYVYSPHEKQRDFHRAVNRHKVTLLNAGRGTGKTLAGVMQSLYFALSQTTNGMIVAPTYDMLMDIILPMFFEVLPADVMANYHKQSKRLNLPNGSIITFRSGDDPNRLRGANRDWVWLDEARNYKTADVYRVALAQLRNGIIDKMWITTTPAGLYHWLYQDLVQNAGDGIGFISASTKDNPYLPNDYYQFLQSQYTGVFAEQELEGKFVSFEGLVYDSFSLSENVAPVEYDPDRYTYLGVDDGYAHGGGVGTLSYHPRVILVMQMTGDGTINVIDEFVATQELPEVTLARVFERYPKITTAYVDSSASELRRRLSDKSIQNAGATHRVSDGIKVVRRYVMDGNGKRLLKINPRCKTLIREMQMYRYSDTTRSEAGEAVPMKQDDHALDALRYAVYYLGRFT